MEPARVACVRYLNTAPLVEGLDRVEGLTLIPAVPSSIVGLVQSGEADLGLASVVDAVGLAGTPDPGLALVPVGMIGCDGPTYTVRVFSAVPFEQITTLHADTDSHTSVVLAQVLLAQLHNRRVKVEHFHARERVGAGGVTHGTGSSPEEAWPETVLLIGDKVVTDHPPRERYPYEMDLGEAWKRLTGLPFVYAVWQCRREQAGSPRVREAAALLDRQRRHNATRLDWIVSKRAAEARWPEPLAREYLGRLLRYEVGEREKEAVGRFFALGAELGVLAGRAPPWAAGK